MKRTGIIDYAKYFAALLLFGSNGIVASHISLTSYDIVYLRTMIGSVLLILIYLLTGNRFHIRQYKRDFMFVCVSGIALGTSWLFLYEAYQLIGVSFSSLLYYCGPVIVMVLSPVLFHEKLTAPVISGFIVVLAGILLVNGESAMEGTNTWGLVCGAMSAVLYSVMIICNKCSQKIVGFENSVISVTVSFLTAAVFTIARQGMWVSVEPDQIPWVLFLGVINTGIGCYLYFSPMDRLPVQTVAVCGYLEPLSAVVFSALFLGEEMAPLQIVGAGCIIGGAMLGELTSLKTDTHKAGAKV